MNRALAKKLIQARHWTLATAAQVFIGVLKLVPARLALGAVSAIAPAIGKLTPRHKIALDNLRKAFPEKSADEINKIAMGMWRNMGLLAAEYVYLDQLFDYHPDNEKPGRVEVQGLEIFERLHSESGRYVFFTGHTGNFELLPICAATFGLEITALFRPPNNPYIAKKVLAARETNMGTMVPSKAGAAWALASALDRGKSVGMLVDQKFKRGKDTQFFNRPVKTNPLAAKLARQYDCPVHPARCIRLPGGRFRLELEEAVELPRDNSGEIDLDASCQVFNDVIERWVREYPDQWMWFHRRWKTKA